MTQHHELKMRSFRLSDQDAADLDRIAQLQTETQTQIIGRAAYPWNRTMALRYAITRALDEPIDERPRLRD